MSEIPQGCIPGGEPSGGLLTVASRFGRRERRLRCISTSRLKWRDKLNTAGGRVLSDHGRQIRVGGVNRRESRRETSLIHDPDNSSSDPRNRTKCGANK